MPTRRLVCVTLACGALLAYLLLVFALGETIFATRIGLPHVAVALVAGLALTAAAASRLARSPLGAGLAVNAAVACGALTLALLVGDVLYTVGRNASPAYRKDATPQRYGDSGMWCRRLFPPFYWPTERNFRLYKPGVRLEGVCEGDLADPLLAERFPGVARRVTQPRRVVVAIDGNGFRDTTSMADAEVFALGDSFVFGYGISQDDGWVEVFERRTGTPVYNLGITDSSPGEQLRLLRHLLATRPELGRMTRLLWMIFEGNDLEDSYADTRPAIARYPRTAGPLTEGTVLEDLRSLAYRFRGQSMLRALLTGGTRSLAGDSGARPTEIGDLLLRRPLYHSERFGYRFFEPRYVARAAQPEAYVLRHPNRGRLDQALDGMAALASEHGFAVNLILAPSAPRLYAASFDGLEVSERPHFLDYVARRSRDLGFEIVDLHVGMRRRAERELLFWRDDGHWNRRGNALAARLVARSLARADGDRP